MNTKLPSTTSNNIACDIDLDAAKAKAGAQLCPPPNDHGTPKKQLALALSFRLSKPYPGKFSRHHAYED